MQSVRGPLSTSSDAVTVAIRWWAPIPALLAVGTFAIIWGRIDSGTESAALAASIAGWGAVASVGVIQSRASARKWIAALLCLLAVFTVPGIAVHLLPAASRHEWYAVYPVSFATAVLVVYAYVAVSRLPGFGVLVTPAVEPEQAGAVMRMWTPDERAARLGVSTRRTFRRTYPIVFNGLAFAFLTLLSFLFALAALADDAWAIGVIISVICVFFGRTTLRAFRLNVIADADGITVRNLQWTHRMMWSDIQRIVPPSADQYRCVRIDRLHRGPVRCTSLAKSIFQRRHALDHYADELSDLIGPRPGQDGGMASAIPTAARDFVRAVTQAVDTAVTGDEAATYHSVTAQLATQPVGGRVLGDVLRSLLEDTHPDGLNSDDITLVIGRCYRAAAAWLPPDRIDVTMLLAVLAGALGIHEPAISYEALDLARSDANESADPDGTVPVKPPTWPDYAWHAPLLVADLLPFAPATLDSYLESIFAEYAREAREELP